jgi:shikimate kinase
VDFDEGTAIAMGARTAGDALAASGEQAFRNYESMLLPGVLSQRGFVVALGGGTPTAPDAERTLKLARDSGDIVIIYLRTNPIVLRERLASTNLSDRPSLTGQGTLEEIDRLFHARDALYRRLASHTLEVGSRTEDDVVAEIARITP